MVLDIEELDFFLETLRFRGVKGTTGTAASFLELFDGDYIIRYSDYKRIAKWDGTYLSQYPNSRRIAILECPGRRSALAAAAYLLN